jgi:acetyl-CoA carboxylase alpha subunit
MKITFDFEKPLAELQQQIEKVKQVEDKNNLDVGHCGGVGGKTAYRAKAYLW